MKYDDLLANQDRELNKLNFDYRESRDNIRQMQKDHFDPEKFEPDFERLEAAYLRDREAMNKRHQQERKDFLNEPELEVEKPKAKDMDTAYDKTVVVEINGLREETKEERIERKMREWDEAQRDKTRKLEITMP